MEATVSRVVREYEAAKILGVSVASLRRWRHEHRGPVFVRIERCVGYRLSDLEAFLTAATVRDQNVGPRRK